MSHPNVSKEINDAIEGLKDKCEVDLHTLPVGTVLEVETRTGSIYRFEFDRPADAEYARDALCSGGGIEKRYGKPTRVTIAGATWGHGGMLHIGFITEGMSIEMYIREHKKEFATSSVQAWRFVEPADAERR